MSATAVAAVEAAYDRIDASERDEIWIALVPRHQARAAAAAIDRRVADGAHLPLAGTTVAIKDNIDLAGMATTAACPAYASHPDRSAVAVARLQAAGAVVVGKTNLDQFATGLVGTRSPFGAVRNAIDPTRVSGGSSSGSAVAVALGLVDLALGTDTAGSGRVPAAFNGVYGLKPTRGLVSTTGVVPACASFDCVSVFARDLELGQLARSSMTGYDDQDPASRDAPASTTPPPVRVVGVPPIDALDLDDDVARAFAEAVDALREHVEVVAIDLAPFDEAGALLYGGGFVAERYAAVGAFVDEHPDDVDPTVASIIRAAKDVPAHRLAADNQRLRQLRRQVHVLFRTVDAVVVPTAPLLPTIAAVHADPIGLNTRLGRFTAPVNLLDLCAVSVPAGATADGLPFGVSLHAPAFHDAALTELAVRLAGGAVPPAPASIAPEIDELDLVVAGAHLRGQPLNHQLTERGGRLIETTTTSASYGLYALRTDPPKPGLVWRAGGGAPIEVERWRLPAAGFASFVVQVPAPMAIGAVELADGSSCTGFTCMPHALDGATDITADGGWRAYLARPASA